MSYFGAFDIAPAGWIGNDAISPIIGEHDPYYHVSARVRRLVILMLLRKVWILTLCFSVQYIPSNFQSRNFSADFESPFHHYLT